MTCSAQSRTSLLRPLHLQLMAALELDQHLGEAAQRIGVSQPAASRMLTEIEALVGMAIHARKGRGLELTEAGLALAHRARRIKLELENAGQELAEIRLGNGGHVRIGAVTTAALDVVLPALKVARQDHPKLTLDVTVGPSRTLCDGVRQGIFDFALGRLVTDVDRRELSFEPIGTEPVRFIVRAGHPLTKLAEVTVSDLLEFDWVMPDKDSPLGKTVSDYLHGSGQALPQQQLSTASHFLTLTMVKQSDAVAPLAKAAADIFADGPDSGYAQLSVAAPLDVGYFGIITLNNPRFTGPRAVFLELLRNSCAAVPKV